MKQRFFITAIVLLIIGQFSAVGELKITIDNTRWHDLDLIYGQFDLSIRWCVKSKLFPHLKLEYARFWG